MRFTLLSFAAGVWWLQVQADLPPAPGALLAVLLPLGAWALVLRDRAAGRGAVRAAALLLCAASGCAFAAGFAWAAWRAEARLADALAQEREGEDVRVVGVIDDLPLRTERGWRFALAVERVLDAGAAVPGRVSVAWPARPARGLPEIELPTLAAGERWQFTLRLRRPHGNVNPGGFDIEGWLFERGIRATGSVARDGEHCRLDAFAGRPTDHVQRLRDRLRARMLAALEGRPYAGVVVALAIGEQREVAGEQWQTFNRLGIGHLLAISGLHVTLFAVIVGGATLALWRRVPALALRLPAQKAAAIVGLVAAAGYVQLAGAQVPAQRTLYMLAAAALALWFGVPGRASSVLVFALTAVLLIDPWAVRAPGFWLSFGAVSVIIAAGAGRIGPLPAWKTAVRTQAAVTVGLAPLSLLLFQQVSLVSPLANAVAIPVVTYLVTPLTLFSLAVPAQWSLVLAHEVFAILAALLEPLAHLPAAVREQHAPGPGAMVAGAVATLAFIAPRGLPGKAAGLVWLAPLLCWTPSPPAEGAFRATVLDVGQGLAVVVETHRHALAYDAGPRFTDQADAGNRIVVPFLRAAGVRRLDGLVVSHNDIDHSGGALSVLAAVPVGWLAASVPEDADVWRQRRATGGDAWSCVAGQAWEWDGVRFEMLHPGPGPPAAPGARARKPNDASCVLRVQSPHGSLLIAGDIEALAERELLARGAQAVRADVVIAPHHGSRTSSTPAFVTAVAAAEAMFTVGHRNRFGHPVADVVARYRAAGARVLRTDRDGAVRLEFGPVLEIRRWRAEEPRYWRAEADPGRSLLE
jgi:competence protein ComEC